MSDRSGRTSQRAGFGAAGMALSLVLLAALALIALGCGSEGRPGEDFVGTWTHTPEGWAKPLIILELRSDGSGNQTAPPDPHAAPIKWVIRGDELIVSPRGGSTSQVFGYEFESPDRMTLVTEDGAVEFVRQDSEG